MEELCPRHPGRLGRIVQSVLRYNVAIVGKFFNKGSWVSDAWRKQHPEEFEEAEEPPERIAPAEERMERLNNEPVSQNVVCVRSSDTPLPRGVGLTPRKGETKSQ